MRTLARILDALAWRYEDRFPRLANWVYDWLARREATRELMKDASERWMKRMQRCVRGHSMAGNIR